MGNKEAVVSCTGLARQIGGLGQIITNFAHVFTVTSSTCIAHLVGVRCVGVSAIKHITVELVHAEFVLVQTVQGDQFRFLLNVQ